MAPAGVKQKAASFWVILKHGFAKTCPRCGGPGIFQSLLTLIESCPSCGCPIRAREEDTYFLMYLSTAALTGLCILGMLAITPKSLWVGRLVVVSVALSLYLGTYQRRKSIAIAIEYYVETRSNP